MELLGNQKLLKSGKSGLEGWWHSFLYGAAATKAKIGELTVEQNRVLDLIKRIDAAQKQANAENARAYANSPKGKIEQLQKEEKARISMNSIQLEELKNATSLQLLYGQISDKQAEQATALSTIRNLTGEIEAKQLLMSQIKMIDPSNTEEITKIRTEIAQLQGKKIQIELQLKREAFDRAVAELGRTSANRIMLLDTESKLLQQTLSVQQAITTAESGRLGFELQSLQYAKEQAKNDTERLGFAQRMAVIQKQQADLAYNSALSAIQMGIQQAAIEVKKADIKFQELRAVVLLAQAQGFYNEAHGQALIAAREALYLAQQTLTTTTNAAKYQRDAAGWQRKSAYAAADNALYMARIDKSSANVANNTRKAAKGAADFADNLERAGGVQLKGFSSLEPWMEKKVQDAKNYAIKNGPQLDSYSSYIRGINAEIDMRTNFQRIIGAQTTKTNQERDTEAEKTFWDQAKELGFGKFASGGFVTSPTLGLVGEGGESEYIIPESQMGAASARYLAGAQGGAVLGSSTNVSSGSTGEPTINIKTGPVLEFNGQRYVTMGDFERGLRATANGVFGALRTPAGRYAIGVR